MALEASFDDKRGWILTSATIVSCRYQFSRLNTLTMGIQTGEKFRIAFEYYAHARLYSGDFQSRVAVAQGETVPVRYNPLNPQQNSLSDGMRSSCGGSWMAVGAAVSIALSLVWLGILRGCSE